MGDSPPQTLSIFFLRGNTFTFCASSKHIKTIWLLHNILERFLSDIFILFSELFNQFILDFYLGSARYLEWTEKSGLIG
jgi:hypothetical protein